MKKLLLLLAFVINASLSFAMTGPVRSVEPQKLLIDEGGVVKTGCLVCTTCGSFMVCAFGVNCDSAIEVLAKVMEGMKCGETDDK